MVANSASTASAVPFYTKQTKQILVKTEVNVFGICLDPSIKSSMQGIPIHPSNEAIHPSSKQRCNQTTNQLTNPLINQPHQSIR